MVQGDDVKVVEPPKRELATPDNATVEDPVPTAKKAKGMPERRDCPYLGTINRNVLDFDFEKVCCISLSNLNPYCCLICGKFYQGRGKHTKAYTHAVEENHYVFLNLTDGRVYCLPDNYEVVDASLNDIKYNLHPTYDDVDLIGSQALYAKSLDGADFIPGCVGLNIIKNSDYMNVVIQVFCNVIPWRNFLLKYKKPQAKADPVLCTLAELMRKIYNKRNFKGIVSPHEFFQAVGRASGKHFFTEQRDPVSLLSWLVGHLKKKLGPQSALLDSIEGEVITKTAPATDETKVVEARGKSIMLTLDLPDEPLFKDNLDFIPQVPLFNLLEKFNGEKLHEIIGKGGEHREVKRFSLRKLPPYMIFLIKRFRKNNFFVEKNPTVVNFPLKDLDLAECVHPDAIRANAETKYDLVANVVHEGKPESGSYKIQILHGAAQQWYEMQDLRVTPILPQMVAVTESYLQIYQRHDVKSDGSFEPWCEEKAVPEETARVEDEGAMAVDELAEAGIIIG